MDLMKIGYVEEGEGVYIKSKSQIVRLDEKGFRHF
jgi:thiamine-monophosphate kinase